MNKKIIEQLLYESESNSLDFKEKQYKIIKASEREKSELLKDIIAFANSWRRSEAFILLGIKENPGKKAIVVGIDESLDDASLQQFINSKLNKKINFKYYEMTIEEKIIGVLEIKKQKRPFYLLNDYGKLRKNIVYYRMGSSTEEASPDDIVDIYKNETNEESLIPIIDLYFFDPINEEPIVDSHTLNLTYYNLPDKEELPDFWPHQQELKNYYSNINKEYYKNFRDYFFSKYYCKKLNFVLINRSKFAIKNIRLSSCIKMNDNINILDTSSKLLSSDNPIPKPQKKKSISVPTPYFPNARPPRNALYLDYEWQKHRWLLNLWSDDIFPGEELVFKEGIYVGFKESTELIFSFNIIAENLSEPIQKQIKLKVNVDEKEVNKDELLKLADQEN